MSLSSEDYRVPPWSGVPTLSYCLEVVKEGAIIQELTLQKKPFILIGKHPDLCDIVLENPSISRKHAILQFRPDEQAIYLYDLGSTHGTTVNRRSIPSRVFHKLGVFDTIVFGSSAKGYVLRCPELEQKLNQAEVYSEEEQGTEFQKMLKKQHQGGLSKEQTKEKYMDMLENDPYYKAAQGKSRDFQGEQHKEEEGINWGITNDYQVYAYRDENDYPLEPDLLRRLPGIDNTLMDKISEYQQKLQKYQECEGQLRDLANRQQRQFGLEEKARTKKQDLEKKVVELSQEMEKVENSLKMHLFGEGISKKKRQELREKEGDTFQDDEFFDRTLEKKEELNLQKIRREAVSETTEDYWRVKGRLEELLLRRRALQEQLVQSATRTYQPADQQDEYDKFMNATEDRLKIQTHAKLVESIKVNEQEITIYKQKLEKIRPSESGLQISFETIEQRKVDQSEGAITAALNKLERQKNRHEKEMDEQDPSIFEYYEKVAKQEELAKKLYREAQRSRQLVIEDKQVVPDKDPSAPQKRPKPYQSRNAPRNHQQEQYFDLTQKFE